MREFLFIVFLSIVFFASSDVQAGRIVFDFEYDTPADSIWPWAATRDFNRYNDIKVVTDRAYSGTHSVQLPLIDTLGGVGALSLWLLYCNEFLDQATWGDSIWYYLYIPAGAPVDSICAFTRDSDWTWSIFSIYQNSDLAMDAWNELICIVSDTTSGGDTIDLPIIQCDLWIYTNSSVANPACTLYLDSITFGWDGSGIELPQKNEGILKITKNSINCIEYSLISSAHILIEIFNLSGQKVAVKVPGRQLEGPHRIYVDLPAGIYLAKITADKEKGVSKFISVE